MKRFTIEYKDRREVFVENEADAREHAWDCTLSVIEAVHVSDIQQIDDVNYCGDCG